MNESIAAPGGARYAGFWWRVLAAIIDTVLFNLVMGLIFGWHTLPPEAEVSPGTPSGIIINGPPLLILALHWLYFTLLESSQWQATIGKKLLGLYVTDEADGRISFGRANGRYWSKIISGLILFIGFLMVAFTARKQGLHDLIARTLVMKK